MTEQAHERLYGTILPAAFLLWGCYLWLSLGGSTKNPQCILEGEGLSQALVRAGGFNYPITLRFPDGTEKVIVSGADLIDGSNDMIPIGTCYEVTEPTLQQ